MWFAGISVELSKWLLGILVPEWLPRTLLSPTEPVHSHPDMKVWASGPSPVGCVPSSKIPSAVVEELGLECTEAEASPQGILAIVIHVELQAQDLVLTDEQSK